MVYSAVILTFIQEVSSDEKTSARCLLSGEVVQLGPFSDPTRILSAIAEGDPGAAKQLLLQVEPVRRKVALKLVKPAMDTRQIVARFEPEREALAIMDYANIAR